MRRRGLSPRPKLGKLLYCHCTTPALVRVEFLRYILPSSQQSYIPSAGGVQRDSSWKVPNCDCSHDGMRASPLVEAGVLSRPDARIHTTHWFRTMEYHASSGFWQLSDPGNRPERSAEPQKEPGLSRNRGQGDLRLTREGCGRMVLRRNGVEIGNSDSIRVCL